MDIRRRPANNNRSGDQQCNGSRRDHNRHRRVDGQRESRWITRAYHFCAGFPGSARCSARHQPQPAEEGIGRDPHAAYLAAPSAGDVELPGRTEVFGTGQPGEHASEGDRRRPAELVHHSAAGCAERYIAAAEDSPGPREAKAANAYRFLRRSSDLPGSGNGSPSAGERGDSRGAHARGGFALPGRNELKLVWQPPAGRLKSPTGPPCRRPQNGNPPIVGVTSYRLYNGLR